MGCSDWNCPWNCGNLVSSNLLPWRFVNKDSTSLFYLWSSWVLPLSNYPIPETMNNNHINNNAFHKLLVQIAKPEKEREREQCKQQLMDIISMERATYVSKSPDWVLHTQLTSQLWPNLKMSQCFKDQCQADHLQLLHLFCRKPIHSTHLQPSPP